MSYETKMENNETVDFKVAKRHYPRTNNKSVLEFVFEKDPNLFLRKNKISSRGFIQVHKHYAVQNGWASKLFSNLTVEINSQTITKHNNRFHHIFDY